MKNKEKDFMFRSWKNTISSIFTFCIVKYILQ